MEPWQIWVLAIGAIGGFILAMTQSISFLLKSFLDWKQRNAMYSDALAKAIDAAAKLKELGQNVEATLAELSVKTHALVLALPIPIARPSPKAPTENKQDDVSVTNSAPSLWYRIYLAIEGQVLQSIVMLALLITGVVFMFTPIAMPWSPLLLIFSINFLLSIVGKILRKIRLETIEIVTKALDQRDQVFVLCEKVLAETDGLLDVIDQDKNSKSSNEQTAAAKTQPLADGSSR